MKGIVVLSCFDGMSCGQIALQRAGVKVKKYFASEIDKHAIKVTQHNFPKTIQLGDIKNVHAKDLPVIDLIIGGSPCQGFSFAGKRLNFEDPRSVLFFEFVRLYNELREKNANLKFLLENVKMEIEHVRVISKYMNVWPIEINSALVSAQNRERLYWTNINEQPYGLFGELKPVIALPKDKGLLLKDVLEADVPQKYYLSDKAIAQLTAWEKKHQEKENGFKIGWGDANGKTNTLTSRYFKDGKECLIVEKKIKQLNPSTESCNKQPYQTNRVYDTSGISPALSSESQGRPPMIVAQKESLVQIGNIYNNDHNSVAGRVYTDEGKSVTLSALGGGGGAKTGLYQTDTGIRRLTPVECERLQTVPDRQIICIFNLCLDQVKNYVSAVEQNPKLLKLALNAEDTELNEFVKHAINPSLQNNPQTKHIVQQNVGMQINSQTEKCTRMNLKETSITVGSAENFVMSKNLNQEVDSVLPNAFINIIEERITYFGKEELLPNGTHSTVHMNGGQPLKLSGSEIMELVKNVSSGTLKKGDVNSTYTILSALNINNIELLLAIFYLFAKNAISGYIQDGISKSSLSVQFQINEGYTACVSDTQRYRMLGNGWTIDVIVIFLSFF